MITRASGIRNVNVRNQLIKGVETSCIGTKSRQIFDEISVFNVSTANSKEKVTNEIRY